MQESKTHGLEMFESLARAVPAAEHQGDDGSSDPTGT